MPSHRILVLNRLWQPVNIVGVKRGFSLLCQDYAQVIHTSDGVFDILDFGSWVEHSSENPPENPGRWYPDGSTLATDPQSPPLACLRSIAYPRDEVQPSESVRA